MARFDAQADIRPLAEALAALRRDRGLSQAEAGRRAGMTSQGWGLYEGGKRPGLFRPDVQRRLTAALDATPEDLALLTGAPMPTPADASDGLHSTSRAFKSPIASPRERLRLTSDELAPWAASGTVIEYAPGRWPRAGQGCVVDLNDGTRLVRLYEGAEPDRVRLRGGAGGLDAVVSMDRARITSIAAVIARLDDE